MDPAKRASILRAAAYHCEDFDLAVISTPLHELDVVGPLLSEAFPLLAGAEHALGSLSVLPVEMLSAVCLHLDIQALCRLRQVSRLARHVVAGLPEYHAVTTHAKQALVAILRTGIGPSITLAQLHRQLCTSKCSECDAFGSHLFLPTAQRCCFVCLTTSRRLAVAPVLVLAAVMALPELTVSRVLPVVRSVPGSYGTLNNRKDRRLGLAAVIPALDTLWAPSMGVVMPEPLLRVLWNDSVLRCMVAVAFPALQPGTGAVDHGVNCAGCRIAAEANADYDAYLMYNRDKVYTADGFLAHFASCGRAQEVWEMSIESAPPPPPPDSHVGRSGGFLDLLLN